MKKTGLTEQEWQVIRKNLQIIPKIEKAVLFGSRAMGLARSNSDVDILLYGNELTLHDVAILKNAFEETTLPYGFDLIIYDTNNTELLTHIKDYGQVIFDKSNAKWKHYKLSELCDIIGGGTPKTQVVEYWGGEIPWLSVVDFNNESRNVYTTEKSITELGLQNSSTKYLQKGDIIISARGTVGALAQLGKDMTFNQSCYGLKANIHSTNDFLYYLVKNSLRELKQQVHGSVFDTITKDTFDKININLPPLPEQKAIAETLSCLDDKIENNNAINKNLEEMAQAIFKSWFIDFEPFKDGEFEDSELGKIPKGWRVGKASEFYNIKIGKTPPRNESEWFSRSPNDINWLSISDMGSDGIYSTTSKEYLTHEAIAKFNVNTVEVNTVLLSFKLTVGRVRISNCKMATNEAIAHFNTNNKHLAEFTYLYLKNFEYFSLGSTSSIATAVNSKIIKAMPFLMPNDNILQNFYNLISPLFMKIRLTQQEMQQLTEIRDALLPKLMSGEIRVPVEVE